MPVLLAALALLLAVQDPDVAAPPGLVPVRGGRTKIGSTFEQVEDLIRARPELYLAVPGEAPQFTLDVEDFLLMPTEVTNEQYGAFVRATGAKPPRTWGVAAVRAGQTAFLDAQAKAKQEALLDGKSFEAGNFDADAWWEEHWRTAQWEVPGAEATHPVVFVSCADAERYARWAGARLMTEFEYQRAGRGDSARTYPWGDDWDDKRFCQSLQSGRDSTAPVGAFPDGAHDGIHDLAGNVWEWTASPFTPYPGYKPVRVKLDDRVVEGFGPFAEDQRVVVGGSFQMDRSGVRLAIRKYTDPTQATSALGFRCAASPAPGLDAARWLVQAVAPDVLASDAALDPAAAVALRRWESEPGTASVPGYRVITRYEHVVVCPLATVTAATPAEVAALTARSKPIVIALFSVPAPLGVSTPGTPPLGAGDYLVAWRAAGPLNGDSRTRDAAYEPSPLEDVPGFLAAQDCFILYDLAGAPLFALPAPPVTAGRAKPCRIELGSAAPAASTEAEPAAGDAVRFHIAVPSSRTNSKAFFFELELALQPGSLAADWR